MNTMNNFLKPYDAIIMMVDQVFIKKAHDLIVILKKYRAVDLIDQIGVRAQRIKDYQMHISVPEGYDMKDDFVEIVNYSAMGCIQLHSKPICNTTDELIKLYEGVLKQALNDMLIRTKGKEEVLNSIDTETFNHLILQYTDAVKSSLNGNGISGVSLKEQFLNIINYAIFALMVINKEENK